MTEQKIKNMDVDQICNEMRVNKNTRSYIVHKYKGKEMSEKEWKSIFKKDGLSF